MTVEELSEKGKLSFREILPSLLKRADYGFNEDDCYRRIDLLANSLPEHDFNSATSFTCLTTNSLPGIMEQVCSYLGLDSKVSKAVFVSACSREGKEMSVALGVENKRASFDVNPQKGTPEIILQEKREGKWKEVEKIKSFSWEQFEGAIVLAESLVTRTDLSGGAGPS